MKKYEPELGQMVNGQPYKEYEASEELVTALECLANCYGIGIDGNTFKISYKAKCMLCGFEYSYNVVKDI